MKEFSLLIDESGDFGETRDVRDYYLVTFVFHDQSKNISKVIVYYDGGQKELSSIIPESNSCELYFEEADIEGFVDRLETYYPEVRYVNRLMTHSWGQKVVRFYDPDGNLIEVGTPM